MHANYRFIVIHFNGNIKTPWYSIKMDSTDEGQHETSYVSVLNMNFTMCIPVQIIGLLLYTNARLNVKHEFHNVLDPPLD